MTHEERARVVIHEVETETGPFGRGYSMHQINSIKDGSTLKHMIRAFETLEKETLARAAAAVCSHCGLDEWSLGENALGDLVHVRDGSSDTTPCLARAIQALVGRSA